VVLGALGAESLLEKSLHQEKCWSVRIWCWDPVRGDTGSMGWGNGNGLYRVH